MLLFFIKEYNIETEDTICQYFTIPDQSDCKYLGMSSCYCTVPSTIWEILSEFHIFCNLFYEPLG